jgi:hypothetical protein
MEIGSSYISKFAFFSQTFSITCESVSSSSSSSSSSVVAPAPP